MSMAAYCPIHEYEWVKCSDLCEERRAQFKLASRQLTSYWSMRRRGRCKCECGHAHWKHKPVQAA